MNSNTNDAVNEFMSNLLTETGVLIFYERYSSFVFKKIGMNRFKIEFYKWKSVNYLHDLTIHK